VPAKGGAEISGRTAAAGWRKSPALSPSLYIYIYIYIYLLLYIYFSLSPSCPISPRWHLSTNPRQRWSFHRPGKLPRLARTHPSIRGFLSPTTTTTTTTTITTIIGGYVDRVVALGSNVLLSFSLPPLGDTRQDTRLFV